MNKPKHKVSYHYSAFSSCGDPEMYCCVENDSYITVTYVNEAGEVTGSRDFDVNVTLKNAEQGAKFVNDYFSVGAHLYEFDADNSEFYGY